MLLFDIVGDRLTGDLVSVSTDFISAIFQVRHEVSQILLSLLSFEAVCFDVEPGLVGVLAASVLVG